MNCLNCGKKGHYNWNCLNPKNSYGCVIFKKSNDNVIRYLLIQQKYTPEYIELIRGKYYEYYNTVKSLFKYNYLLQLIMDLPIIERHYIMNYQFDYLWKNVWQWVGTNSQMQQINTEYIECEEKFNRLKNGCHFEKYGFISFKSLFKMYPNTIIEPNWEFPKGKRKMGECDQKCAIRECCEETSLKIGDFSIYQHVKPFQEQFVGINSIEYCNNYYIAKLTNYQKLIYYDHTHSEQNKEIRKIGWFTENEIKQLVNPKSVYRLKMINQITSLIPNLD